MDKPSDRQDTQHERTEQLNADPQVVPDTAESVQANREREVFFTTPTAIAQVAEGGLLVSFFIPWEGVHGD